jgi:hypothetical protein
MTPPNDLGCADKHHSCCMENTATANDRVNRKHTAIRACYEHVENALKALNRLNLGVKDREVRVALIQARNRLLQEHP